MKCPITFGLLALVSTFASAQPIDYLGKRANNDLDPLFSCERGCRDADGDDLFPKGSLDSVCYRDCKLPPLARYAPPNPGVRPSGNNRAFVLLEDMRYQIGASRFLIVVPAGFVTDYASIPRALWSIASPHDQYSRAAVIHDYLYWTQLCSKRQSDNIFMIAMKESDVPTTTRDAVYLGVSKGGDQAWSENQKERAKKLPRVVPVKRKDFPPNWSWEMYRGLLAAQGVVDPEFPAADYCSAGNTTEVPGNTPSKDRVGVPVGVVRAATGTDAQLLKIGPR